MVYNIQYATYVKHYLGAKKFRVFVFRFRFVFSCEFTDKLSSSERNAAVQPTYVRLQKSMLNVENTIIHQPY